MPLYFIYITLALLTSLIGFTLLHFYKLERQHDKLIQMESRWTDIQRLLNQLQDARAGVLEGDVEVGQHEAFRHQRDHRIDMGVGIDVVQPHPSAVALGQFAQRAHQVQ